MKFEHAATRAPRRTGRPQNQSVNRRTRRIRTRNLGVRAEPRGFRAQPKPKLVKMENGKEAERGLECWRYRAGVRTAPAGPYSTSSSVTWPIRSMRAVEQTAQQCLQLVPMLTTGVPRVLLQLLLDQVEGVVVDDPRVSSSHDLIGGADARGIERVRDESGVGSPVPPVVQGPGFCRSTIMARADIRVGRA